MKRAVKITATTTQTAVAVQPTTATDTATTATDTAPQANANLEALPYHTQNLFKHIEKFLSNNSVKRLVYNINDHYHAFTELAPSEAKENVFIFHNITSFLYDLKIIFSEYQRGEATKQAVLELVKEFVSWQNGADNAEMLQAHYKAWCNKWNVGNTDFELTKECLDENLTDLQSVCNFILSIDSLSIRVCSFDK